MPSGERAPSGRWLSAVCEWGLITASTCELLVEAASYNLKSPVARGPGGTLPQPATNTRPQTARRTRRMLFTSLSLHRPRPVGSGGLGKRGGELEGLGLGQVAFDPDHCSSVVEDQRVGGEPDRLVPEVAVRIGEEEFVEGPRDPVALVAADRDGFERGAG